MKITKVETILLRVPLIRPIKMSIGTVSDVDHVIVQVFIDEEIVGVGETASESGPIFNEEFQKSIISVIDDYIGPALVGETPLEIEKILDKMDKVAKGNWFAKSAVEMAMYDILGKKWGVPVYQLLGGLYRNKAILSAGANSMDPERDAELAMNAVKEGCKLIKMKVGAVDSKIDIERVKAVRKNIGLDINLIIDVNGAWSAEEATKIIKQIEDYNVIVEQPVPRGDDRGLRKIRSHVNTPIMLDESVFTPQDALNAIINETGDIFSIKISKAGGLYRAKKIAAIAESAGIPCYVGAMEEIGVGMAAGLHFIMSTKNVKYGCELRPNYSQDIVKPNIKVEQGYVYVPEGPGLGINLNEEALRKYRVDKNS
jgi:muconate cycloisomerase